MAKVLAIGVLVMVKPVLLPVRIRRLLWDKTSTFWNHSLDLVIQLSPETCLVQNILLDEVLVWVFYLFDIAVAAIAKAIVAILEAQNHELWLDHVMRLVDSSVDIQVHQEPSPNPVSISIIIISPSTLPSPSQYPSPIADQERSRHTVCLVLLGFLAGLALVSSFCGGGGFAGDWFFFFFAITS